MIHQAELWQIILRQEDDLRPNKYYTYPSGPSIQRENWIASHEEVDGVDGNDQPQVAVIVRTMLTRGEKALGLPQSNKTTVMCLIKLGKRTLPVYFSSRDNHSVVSLEVKQERGSKVFTIPTT